MPNKTEYVIAEDGFLYRRIITEGQVEVTDNTIGMIAATANRKVRQVFPLEGHGEVNGVFVEGWSWWTVPMKKVTLRAPFRLVQENVVPVFNSTTDPILTIDWVPPMTLSMVVQERAADHTRGNAYLFAGTPPDVYRLPLANIFEDCKCCMGDQVNPRCRSSVECVNNTLRVFAEARWNADLWSNTESTFKMFRFKPENEGFVQVAIAETDWRRLCDRCVGDQWHNLLV